MSTKKNIIYKKHKIYIKSVLYQRKGYDGEVYHEYYLDRYTVNDKEFGNLNNAQHYIDNHLTPSGKRRTEKRKRLLKENKRIEKQLSKLTCPFCCEECEGERK